ncbi:hypothetical protein ACGFXC_06525 [Streptomyces sp. NPDC048507]|uniref:hypothetical protein n=1 Tax=Streptomyces sp. NPDC048507 TaxID=3365560 RepID=UPI003717A6A7
MILILGLIILIVAAVVGLTGIFGNMGAAHGLDAGGDFSVFGYHTNGSTGSLFLCGIIVGAAALLGLTLVMLGARRSARRSARARRGAYRRDAVVVDRQRDDLAEQRDDMRADTGVPAADADAAPAEPVAPRGRGHWFGHRTAHR